MATRSGSADLPLHQGRVPSWLASRMERLGRLIVEALVLHYGRDELLRRLGDPFWFQSLGCVMGMDWHSSGITTSVLAALKRGLAPVADELGVYVCGGRGRQSRKTPGELLALGERLGVDGDDLGRTSRLVAKVDSAAVQDGFDLYLHSFVLAADGAWAVVQQGMNPSRRQARRYHWISAGLQSFVEEPHSAIEGPPQGLVLNLTDRRAARARTTQVDLVAQGPPAVVEEIRRLAGTQGEIAWPAPSVLPPSPPRHLELPAHHDVRYTDVMLRRLHGTLRAAADCAPASFEELLLAPGVGGRTIRALALVGEVVHGAPARFEDPARFSFAHGGKDGHPFPVPLDVYDRTLSVMRSAVEQAKLGQGEKLDALRRLDEQVRLAERAASRRPDRAVTDGASDEGQRGSAPRQPSFSTIVERDRVQAARLGGRTVFDARPAPAAAHAGPQPTSRAGQQLALPLGGRRRPRR